MHRPQGELNSPWRGGLPPPLPTKYTRRPKNRMAPLQLSGLVTLVLILDSYFRLFKCLRKHISSVYKITGSSFMHWMHPIFHFSISLKMHLSSCTALQSSPFKSDQFLFYFIAKRIQLFIVTRCMHLALLRQQCLKKKSCVTAYYNKEH